MKVLLTGGMGFIGSYVTRRLLDDGVEVVLIDIDTNANQANLVMRPDELDQVTIVTGDVADTTLFMRVVAEQNIDRIVHLVNAVDATAANPAREVRANIDAFLNVMEAARTFSLDRVVWASSSAVFGSARFYDRPVPRDAPHRATSNYAAHKSHNEAVAEHYARAFGVSAVAIRFPYVFGYGRRISPDRPGFEAALFDAPTRREAGRVRAAEDRTFWLYVEDAAGTVVAALDAQAGTHGAFNSCGSVASPREVAELVAERIPGARFEWLPGTIDFVRDIDDAETVRELGYRQRFDLRAAVARTVDAFARAATGATGTRSLSGREVCPPADGQWRSDRIGRM